MFTGIVTDIGEIASYQMRGDLRLRINTGYNMDSVPLGASIACDGCCLTVAAKSNGWFEADASAETLSKTTLGSWIAGRKVNLERPLKVGDELGGHIVSGHVDGVGTVVKTTPEGGSLRVEVEVPAHLAKFIAPKGSIAMDGVSLTVNDAVGLRFGVNLIPHTREVTNFAFLAPGRQVNLEIDLLARYVARLREAET